MFAKDSAQDFPASERILHEAHVRYAFERFGVPYIVTISATTAGLRRSSSICRDADPVAEKFFNRLRAAGGTPQANCAAESRNRPAEKPSADFTYYGPGDLIPNSGCGKCRAAPTTPCTRMFRFPFANAPAYIKSQSFMPWGDCYRSGQTGKLGRKDAQYRAR